MKKLEIMTMTEAELLEWMDEDNEIDEAFFEEDDLDLNDLDDFEEWVRMMEEMDA